MEPADEPEPPRRAGGARRLHHSQSTPVVSGDLAGTQAELTAVDPDRADWLVSLLGAYESQKLVLDVRSHASSAARWAVRPRPLCLTRRRVCSNTRRPWAQWSNKWTRWTALRARAGTRESFRGCWVRPDRHFPLPIHFFIIGRYVVVAQVATPASFTRGSSTMATGCGRGCMTARSSSLPPTSALPLNLPLAAPTTRAATQCLANEAGRL